MRFILLWLLLTSYFAFLFQKFYYDVSRNGLFVFILLGVHISLWIYELISFLRFGNMVLHITFSNIASVILSLSCLSKAVEHILDLFTFPLYFLCPFTNSPTFLIFMFESGYLLLSCLQVYKTTFLLCPVQTHLLVFNFHYCILWFYNFHFTLYLDIRLPVKYFILSFIFLNMYSCFTVCVW